jgi:hypothetical protein
MTKSIPERLAHLRTRHPTLRYERYAITTVPQGLSIQYTFHLAPSLSFTPRVIIPSARKTVDETTERLAFLVGMVEMLSYWKLACPETIEIAAGTLSDAEIVFWKDLLKNGLGEFFYLNEIPPSINVDIVSTSKEDVASPQSTLSNPPPLDSILVLVGGGKDSIVSLELLKSAQLGSDTGLSSFVLNPIPASLEAIRAAGYPEPLRAARTLDAKLLEMNSQGYYNGHTPFSALLAFLSTLVAYQNGFSHVIASNESSASEGNVTYHGVEVNHQYSKSVHFELAFREYIRSQGVSVEYLSFLRPVNELQICALFSTLRHQHPIFRSCNREQTLRARSRTLESSAALGPVRGWCAECPKCIFTYLCLSCFLPPHQVLEIFGVNPSASREFVPIARALAGLTEHKPFECVGTFEEVRACLHHLFSANALDSAAGSPLAELCCELEGTAPTPQIREIVTRWNPDHSLPPKLVEILKTRLADAAEGLL